jgi:hypothetical protein
MASARGAPFGFIFSDAEAWRLFLGACYDSPRRIDKDLP